MSIQNCFSANYVEARKKFLSACASRGLSVDSRLNPNAKGAEGEDLYMDVARIGPAESAKTLFIMSATHGVEGYCGSGAQVALLNNGYFETLPSDLSVVFIHAMNPYGFSHDRRVTEDNVDLNRNFLDFSAVDRPSNDYPKIHEFILPSDWDGPGREHANKQLAAFIEAHGMKAFQAAVSSGQYTHEDGIFFGGHGPTWSRETFQSVLSDYAGKTKLAAVIDFHTGLGPYGYGELITVGSEAQKARAAEWYGADQVTDPEAGTSTSADLDGMVAHGIAETLSEAEMVFITIEFGTLDLIPVLTSLRGDNWLYQKGEVKSPLGRQIKKDIRAAFYPDADDWRASVWARTQEVTDLALKGIDQMAID